MSACIKSLARCFSAFESTINPGRVRRLVQTAVVISQTSSYQVVNILKVIGVAGRNSAILSNSFLHVIVDSCLSTSNILLAKAKKCLLKVTTLENFESIPLFIAHRVDFLDDSNMAKLLGVLTFIVERWKRLIATSHLDGFIYQVFEIANYNKENLHVLNSIFEFLGSCDSGGLDRPLS
jgi:hypothetical protein